MNKKITVITILSIITGLVIFNTGHNKTNVEEDIKLKSTYNQGMKGELL